MDLSEIRELLSIVADSNVEELTVEEGDLKVTVRKSAATVTMQQPMPQPMPAYAPPAGGSYAPLQQAPAQAPAQPQASPQQQSAAPQPASGGNRQPPADESQAAPSGGGSAEGESDGAAEGTTVPAPIVGTFYRRPSPDDDPYVDVGDTVKEGDVLCIIEAMKLMNEIECETPGTVREIFVEDGEPVEYEQPLFVIDEG